MKDDRSKLRVDFAEFLLKIFLGDFEAGLQCGQVVSRSFCLTQFVERFVELENFFEQLRRSLLLVFAFLARAFDAEEIFDAADGIAQRAVGVVQFRAALKGEVALFL